MNLKITFLGQTLCQVGRQLGMIPLPLDSSSYTNSVYDLVPSPSPTCSLCDLNSSHHYLPRDLDSSSHYIVCDLHPSLNYLLCDLHPSPHYLLCDLDPSLQY